ncbi:hypothetical protein ACWD0J_30940 [Streptomyces sp. NPDC003011]
MALTTFLSASPLTSMIQWLVTPSTTARPLPSRAAVFPLVPLPVPLPVLTIR